MSVGVIVIVIVASILLLVVPGFIGLRGLVKEGHWKTAPFNAFTGQRTNGHGGPARDDAHDD